VEPQFPITLHNQDIFKHSNLHLFAKYFPDPYRFQLPDTHVCLIQMLSSLTQRTCLCGRQICCLWLRHTASVGLGVDPPCPHTSDAAWLSEAARRPYINLTFPTKAVHSRIPKVLNLNLPGLYTFYQGLWLLKHEAILLN